MGNEPELGGRGPAPHQLSVDSSLVNGVSAPLSAVSHPLIAAVSVSSEAAGSMITSVEMNGADRVNVEKKRGRPPKAGGAATPAAKRSKMEEEDVCFICFDGGSLVLCDRKYPHHGVVVLHGLQSGYPLTAANFSARR